MEKRYYLGSLMGADDRETARRGRLPLLTTYLTMIGFKAHNNNTRVSIEGGEKKRRDRRGGRIGKFANAAGGESLAAGSH